jgi:hypothetical protein
VLKEKLSLFEKDYISLQAEKMLNDVIKRIFILGTALSNYTENKQLKEILKRMNVKIPVIYRVLNTMKGGFLLRNAILIYSNIKSKFYVPE